MRRHEEQLQGTQYIRDASDRNILLSFTIVKKPYHNGASSAKSIVDTLPFTPGTESRGSQPRPQGKVAWPLMNKVIRFSASR